VPFGYNSTRGEFPLNPTPNLAQRYGVYAFFAFILLLPFARLSELGCLMGLVLTWSAFKTPLDTLNRTQTGKIARLAKHPAIWVLLAILATGLIASLDATAPSESLKSSAGLLRFIGFCALGAVLSAAQHVQLQRGVALILLFWLLDASLQALTGWSLAGQMSADRLSGIFGADDLKLGPVLAVLSPFVWLAPIPGNIRNQAILRVSTWLLLALILVLAGSRAAWVIFAVVNAALFIRFVLERGATAKQWGQRLAIFTLVSLAFLGIAQAMLLTDTRFQARVDRTMQLLNPSGLDFALAGRLPIWQTALDMSAAHWFNGVGMRGFRHAYPEFAAADDPWVQTNADTGKVQGAFHPHQIVLEISSETGLIGITAWGFALCLCVALYRRADQSQRRLALPYGLALLGMCFPINTHFAFYSTFWGSLFWWLLALCLGALSAKRIETVGALSAKRIETVGALSAKRIGSATDQ
jgi:O-antigen ligase